VQEVPSVMFFYLIIQIFMMRKGVNRHESNSLEYIPALTPSPRDEKR
jgi:hypothetical protein